MTTPEKLESYLNHLDKALKGLAVSDRAEIVTEIKSHVLEAHERDPSQDIGSILASLGEPEQVASKYLLERGMKPSKPSARPIVKWLVIGFLGTVSLFLVMVILVVWKFTPLIEVNEDDVRLLGGTLQIKGDGKDIVNDLADAGINLHFQGERRHFEGKHPMNAAKVSSVTVPFSNGKFDVKTSATNELQWDCRASGSAVSPEVKVDQQTATLGLDDRAGVRCDLFVPKGIMLNLHGSNGKIDVSKPEFPVDISLTNGAIDFKPHPEMKYKYDLSVRVGKIDRFDSSGEKNALPVRIALVNGVIDHN